MAALPVLLVVAYVTVPAVFATWLATEKHRDPTAWFFLGLFFNLFALIALAGAPQGTFVPREPRRRHRTTVR